MPIHAVAQLHASLPPHKFHKFRLKDFVIDGLFALCHPPITMKTRSNPKATQRNLTIPTTGQVLPDGTILDLVRQGAQPSLVFWDGTRATIAPRIEHNSQVYVPPALHPTILRAVRLPPECAPFQPTAELASQMGAVLTEHSDLLERDVTLAICFVFATWFADCLRIPPCLLINGQSAQSTVLLQLLHCLCRRGLLLGSFTASGFCSLPMNLGPTLLIDQIELNAPVRQLLRASSVRNLYVPRKGQLLELCCAKAITTPSQLTDPSIAESAMRIAVPPARRQLPEFDEDVQERIAKDFQPKLLMYRLRNHRKVREARSDVAGVASQTWSLARGWVACFAKDVELESNITSLLRDQDEEIKLLRSSSLEAIVIEAVLFLCHEGERDSAFVHEIAEATNGILQGRRETVWLEPREVGEKLRSLGLFTRRLGSAGRGITLLDADRRRIHQLALAYNVRSVQEGLDQCRHCAETTTSDTADA